MASSSSTSSVIKSDPQRSLIINVRAPEGDVLAFDVRDNMPLERLMRSYGKQRNVAIEQMRFLFSGKRITASDTPRALGMEAEDVIDVVVEQTGGDDDDSQSRDE